jgi:hypothetical protein
VKIRADPFLNSQECKTLPLKCSCNRSKRISYEPLSLSKASNSLLFTTQADRFHRYPTPAPEPIGKRAGSASPSREKDKLTLSAAEILLRGKSIERSGVSDYDLARRARSRPSSIRSSRKSSIRSGRSRPAIQSRRQSIDTVQSRYSYSSTASANCLGGGFNRLIMEEPASLINIPTELVHVIVDFLPRADLLNFVCVNRQLHSDTIMLLYSKPYFTSTYRFAQFVTTVSHNSRLAELVRGLDLSHISHLPKNTHLAGWREWKYRSESLYTVYPVQDKESNNPDRPVHKHPRAHPLLLKYSTGGHDIPLGSLMHVLKACTHLRYAILNSSNVRILNLNDLHISADYVVLPSAPPPRWKPLLPSKNKPPTYHPTAFTKLLFISDVPKSHTWGGSEFRTLRYEEFVNVMCSIDELEVLKIRRALWVKRLFAEEIVRRAGGEIGLRKVDFRECGMDPGHSSWTRRWVAGHDESIRSFIIFK